MPDEQLASCVAGFRTRDQLLAECDVILLPKPQPGDFARMRDGQVLWGWPHCVQTRRLPQLSIDRRLTLIAFEAMNYWLADGSFSLHIFHKNNELAGAFRARSGRPGSLSRAERGRPGADGGIPRPARHRGQLRASGHRCAIDVRHRRRTGILSPGSLIIDVSCEAGMGFSWARPTSFTEPTFKVGNNVSYYAVDHSPSYLWNSATWEISQALLPHLRPVLSGSSA